MDVTAPDVVIVVRGDANKSRSGLVNERLIIHDSLFAELNSSLPQRSLTQGRVHNILDIWAALLPIRISNEILGDYLEDISRRAARGQRLMPLVRMLSTIFWTGVNAVGYFLKEISKRKTA
jgi:hypothetical protein